jgi:methylated-DNA-[protein]-cysteine S-methyltransferase
MSDEPMKYSAVIKAPFKGAFNRLGISTENEKLTGIDYLPASSKLLSASDEITNQVVAELQLYFTDSSHRFTLPIALKGTDFQQRVWRRLSMIATGKCVTYGDLAKSLSSSARAVGGACRSNPIPIIVPCHRVISANGQGGYCGELGGDKLKIKEWLLAHER